MKRILGLISVIIMAGMIITCNQTIDVGDVSGTPTVAIITPVNGTITNISTIAVSGTASIQDGTGSISYVELKQNNSDYVTVTGTSSWSKSVNLVTGTNTFTARAVSDTSKIATSTTWIIVLAESDIEVFITSPANNTVTNKAQITIEGTATNVGYGALTNVEISHNGGTYTAVTGLSSWTYTANLTAGTNSFIARATADDGTSETSTAVNVILNTTVSCAITAPTDLTVTNRTNVIITGTAATDSDFVLVGVELSHDGGSYTAVTGTANWSATSTLHKGTNTFIAKAVDSLSNEVYSSPVRVIIDTTPTVSITTPATSYATNGLYLNLGGTAVSEGDFTIIGVELSHNNGVFTGVTGTSSWSDTVTLEKGTNTFIVRATDSLSNVASVSNLWVYLNSSPSVDITFPSDGTLSSNVTTNLIGTAQTDPDFEIIKVEVSHNGNSYMNVDAFGSGAVVNWTNSVTFGSGTNTFVVRATDSLSNVAYSSEVAIALYENMTVNITAPTVGTVTNVSSIEITGTSSLDGAGSIDAVYIRLNGGTNTLCFGKTSWSSTVTLEEGTNTVVAIVSNTLGGTSTTTPMVVVLDRTIYVSTVGASDSNPGTKDQPVKTIQKAIALAVSNGVNTVYVAESTYTPGNGLNNDGTNGVLITNNNLTLIGGWNSGFTEQTGMSTMDGEDNVYHLLNVSDVTNIDIIGMKIINGNAIGEEPNNNGGGVFIEDSLNILFSQSIMSNNYALRGAGTYASNCQTIQILSNTFSKNTSTAGGAILFQHTDADVIGNYIYDNKASNNKGGGLCLRYCYSGSILDNIIANNYAFWAGGGIDTWYCSNIIMSNIVSNNYTKKLGGAGVNLHNSINSEVYGMIICNVSTNSDGANYGGGIRVVGTSNKIFADIINNTSLENGGGVLISGTYNEIYSLISNNVAATNGGGIYMTGSYNTISGNVTGNEAGYSGGGIECYFSHNNTFNANLIGNSAYRNGGGFYGERLTNCTISGLIINNITLNDGGGIGIAGGTNNTISAVITNNTAMTNGGGLFINNNCYDNDWSSATISENTAGQGFDNVYEE